MIRNDIGMGFSFKPGTFDAAISISALQWLCTAEKKSQEPFQRIKRFFNDLYAVLVRGARCAF